MIHGNARQPGHADHGPVPQVHALHRVRDGRRVARDRRRPPFSGFFSKDEIIDQAFLDDDYGLWIVGLVAAVFTGFYMTRLIFLTFYGNERLAAGDAGGGSRRRASSRTRYADVDDLPTATRRRPCRTATPVRRPHERPRRRTSRRGSWSLPIAGARGPRRGRRASSTCRSRASSSSTSGSSRRSRRRRRSTPTSFVAGLRRSTCVSVVLALDRHRRSRTRSTAAGSRRAERRPARRAARRRRAGPRPRLLLRRRHLASSSTARGRGFAELARPGRRPEIIDGAVNGVGALVERAAPAAPRRCRTASCGATRSASSLGAAALLLYLVIWAGR